MCDIGYQSNCNFGKLQPSRLLNFICALHCGSILFISGTKKWLSWWQFDLLFIASVKSRDVWYPVLGISLVEFTSKLSGGVKTVEASDWSENRHLRNIKPARVVSSSVLWSGLCSHLSCCIWHFLKQFVCLSLSVWQTDVPFIPVFLCLCNLKDDVMVVLRGNVTTIS